MNGFAIAGMFPVRSGNWSFRRTVQQYSRQAILLERQRQWIEILVNTVWRIEHGGAGPRSSSLLCLSLIKRTAYLNFLIPPVLPHHFVIHEYVIDSESRNTEITTMASRGLSQWYFSSMELTQRVSTWPGEYHLQLDAHIMR